MVYKAILFDLDGTLTDSGEGITKSVQYALEKLGKPEPDLTKLRRFVGPPLKKQFQEYAGLDEKEADLAVAYYRERYVPVGLYENAPYEGIEQVLANLKRKKYILAVASSKPEAFVEIVLERFGLAPYFDMAVGSAMDGSLVEKADIIREVLRRLKDEYRIHADSVVMVGDTKYDVEGAREAGLACIAVSYGYGERASLEAARPLCIADSPEGIGDFFG